MLNVIDSFRLDGKVALVTGAGSGLGLACAEGFAEAGADVACLDLDGEAAELAAERVRTLGRSALGIEVNVVDEASVEAAFDRTEETLGPIVIALANAGIVGERASLTETTLAAWNEVVEVDLTGAFLTIRAAARRMSPRGYGKIISTASIVGLRGFEQVPGYTAAKGGVVSLTRAAAAELAASGIRVNAIAPGVFRTMIGGGLLFSDDPEAVAFREWAAQRTPLGYLGEPEQIRGTAVFLASPASDYCTGCVFPLDGGWVAV